MIEVQGLGVTQAETLDEIVPMANDLASQALDIPIEDVELDIMFRTWLPEMGDWVCQCCLKLNQIWSVPDELWFKVAGQDYKILCLVCFITIAEDNFGCGIWRVTNEVSAT